ncbi:MAG: M2 family metallopeptidase [Bacteroidota bacterium]
MSPYHTRALVLLFTLMAVSCSSDVRPEANRFLDSFLPQFQRLYYEAAKAQWLANTDISDEHDSLSAAAEKRWAEYVGSRDVIEKTRSLLSRKGELDTLQTLQLEKIWLQAAHRPATIPEVVDSLIEAGTKQTSLLYGFDYLLPDRAGRTRRVSPNDLDKILVESKDPRERLAAWGTSKEVGIVLKDGLAELQRLRNRVAREMGYSSFFALEVADYGMTPNEMLALMDSLVAQLRPLYSELHTYARHKLARRYGSSVPDEIPAHWLPNRWGQNWPGIIEGLNLDELFEEKPKEWVVEQAERFYVSLGFSPLNQNFWDRSDLYPVEPGSTRKKNNHASAWHLDLRDDYRSLMSVEPNERWFGTTHHELGHIYYYIEYSTPEVPLLLREGANRSYHEGIGDLMDLAALQRPYLEDVGLLPKDREIDQIRWLLNEALSSSSVIFIPWAAGVMTRFEYELYENDLPKEEYNRRWWELVRQYQGIVPPSPRGKEYCDAATKTHIIDDAAQYYDYALSCVLKYHLHDYIARNILGQDPRSCNYTGNKEVGDFLKSIMRPGASRDWRIVLEEKTGESLGARAMLEYYEPLLVWLKEQNRGRKTVLANLEK